MNCEKCGCGLAETWEYCPLCGQKVHEKRKRANGKGSAFKVGASYRAVVVLGYKDDGNPIRRVKGGFASKDEAYAYLPILLSDKDDSGEVDA